MAGLSADPATRAGKVLAFALLALLSALIQGAQLRAQAERECRELAEVLALTPESASQRLPSPQVWRTRT